MGSALLNTTTAPEFAGTARAPAPAAVLDPRLTPAEAASATPDALRLQVAERLAAHRRRRAGAQASSEIIGAAEPTRTGSARSARIAAAVAERYAHTPSYRAFLAAEAERAIDQARAAAEVAAMNAQAIVDAQQRMLDAFDEDAMRRTALNRAQIAEAQLAEAQIAEAQIAEAQLAETEFAIPDEFRATHGGTSQKSGAIEPNLWPDLTLERDRQPARAGRSVATRPSRHGTAADAPDSVGGKQAATVAASTALRSGGLTVRLYEDVAGTASVYRGVTHTNRREYRNDAEALALDEEIAFRQAPVFEEPAGPPLPLPANLIEFPRHLVASRKARPRLAEGPLRDEDDGAPLDGQLRIFEVDAAHISTQPVEADAVAAQWTSIWLDNQPEAARTQDYTDIEHGTDQAREAMAEPSHHAVPAVQVAAIGRRMLAGAADAGIVVAAVLAFAATVAGVFTRTGLWHESAQQSLSLEALRQAGAAIVVQTGLQPAEIAMVAGVTAVFLVMLYQALFFRFSDATPGMRCARIALCTFDDENPTRRAIRRRLGAMLLSAFPLGLGFAWAMLDEQRLTWHDRITRMYLRSY